MHVSAIVQWFCSGESILVGLFDMQLWRHQKTISYEKLKSDHNQTWVKDAIGVSSISSYIYKVKDHVELFSNASYYDIGVQVNYVILGLLWKF